MKCRRCPQEAIPNRKNCKACLEADKIREAGIRQSYKDSGICMKCRKNPANQTPLRCKSCAEEDSFKRKSKWLSRKQKGICCVCGDVVAPDKFKCLNCFNKAKEREKKRKEKAITEGICCHCGAKVICSRHWCITCYLKGIAYRNIGSSKRWTELKELFERQNICPYTHVQLELGVSTSLDHIIPKVRGGDNSINNLQWVWHSKHFDINKMKNELNDCEFRELCKQIANNSL